MFQACFRSSAFRERPFLHRKQNSGLVLKIRRADESGRGQHGADRDVGRPHGPDRSLLRRHRLRQLHGPRHGPRRFPPDLSTGI